MSARKGIILCGHGSRDPLWRQPIEAVPPAWSQRSQDCR